MKVKKIFKDNNCLLLWYLSNFLITAGSVFFITHEIIGSRLFKNAANNYVKALIIAAPIFLVVVLMFVLLLMFCLKPHLKKINRCLASLNQNLNFKTALEKVYKNIFEYDVKNKVLTFGKGSQKILDVAENIVNPQDNAEFKECFSDNCFNEKYFEMLTINSNSQDVANFINETEYSKGNIKLSLYIDTIVFYENGKAVKFIGTIEDVSSKQNELKSLYMRVNTDPLTKTLSRDYMISVIKEALQNEDKDVHALLILDLDAFKQINDSYGHEMGDQVLIKVANTVKHIIRKNDYVARVGGDEYVIFLRGVSSVKVATEKAMQIAESLNTMPVSETIQDLIKCSVGIAIYPDHGESYEMLYKKADNALQNAKKTEKNRCAVYSQFDGEGTFELCKPKNNAEFKELDLFNTEVSLEVNANPKKVKEIMLTALNNNEFELYYMPQINNVGVCYGAEALIRWNSPKYGLIMPLRFITLFEKLNIINNMDAFVLETTIAKLSDWKKRKVNLKLSINQCVHFINSFGYVQNLKNLLDKYNVDPSKLTIEITERAVLSSLRVISKVIEEIRKLNVNVAIDNFGSGYTSLNLLNVLDVNEIKLDRLFLIENADANSKSTKIIKHIVNLATDLNIHILAENVENKKQEKLLLDAGINSLHGYVYDKPMQLAKFEAKYIK